MTRRTGTAVALLFSLCAVPAAGMADTAAPAVVDLTPQAAGAGTAYFSEVVDAVDVARRGDTLGASITIDRLLADPRLALLDTFAQSDVWAYAALVSSAQEQPSVAEKRLRRAVALNPHNSDARLRLARYQMANQQDAAAVESILLALADAGPEPEVDSDMVWHLDMALKQQPTRRLALLQALFDNGWKNEGVEPVDQWVNLATLQVEAAQGDKVAATLERIDAPNALMQLRSDKRFDPYLRRDDPRYDPVAAARRHIDRLRVDAMLSPGLNETALELTNALMVAGQSQEVVGMTDRLADAATKADAAPPEQARYIAWMLDTRSRALRRLGQDEAAINAQLLALRMTDPEGDTVSQTLNLADLYVSLGKPQLARQATRGVEDLSGYGQSARALIDLKAALQLKDRAAAQSARELLFANRVQTPGHYRDALLLDDRLDDAAASLIQALADPMERGAVLLQLQAVLTPPLLPAEATLLGRWDQLKQRADVQAAVARVGRIDTYPLFVD